jgi:hypothetical protein
MTKQFQETKAIRQNRTLHVEDDDATAYLFQHALEQSGTGHWGALIDLPRPASDHLCRASVEVSLHPTLLGSATGASVVCWAGTAAAPADVPWPPVVLY